VDVQERRDRPLLALTLGRGRSRDRAAGRPGPAPRLLELLGRDLGDARIAGIQPGEWLVAHEVAGIAGRKAQAVPVDLALPGGPLVVELGMSNAPEHRFVLGRSEARDGAVLVDLTVTHSESGVVTFRVEPLDGEWRITDIQPLHPPA
jgi:hypothetical protein